MINNSTETGTKKPNLKGKFGRKNIIKSIGNTSLKCIRIGGKRTWIKPVPLGENSHETGESGTLISINGIVSGGRPS
tara:strand:- start:479 stop:709 length:231 start_codon:yes stop_codon:yes gene_type:complete